MKAILSLLLLLGLVGLGVSPLAKASVPVLSPPTQGQTVFWDDFVQSQFPQQWSAQNQVQLNNSTQQGGYLVSTLQRTLSIQPETLTLLANNTALPVIQPNVNQSFTQIVFKLQPFNLTSLAVISQVGGGNPQSDRAVADLRIGLQSLVSTTPAHGVYFELIQSNTVLSNICGTAQTKQAVFLSIGDGGPASGANSFKSCIVSATANEGILYNGGNSPIDLNAQHIFTIQVNMDVNNPTNEYIRYQVDNLGFMTFWQTACNCIGTTYPIIAEYPFVTLEYAVSNTGGAGTPFVMSQSLASQVDFVLATNYIPATLPAGQLLFSNVNPPKKLPQPYNAFGPSDSITAFIQFYANQLGGGNIYAGGLFLSGIFFATIGIMLGTAIYRTKRGGVRELGFMWTLSSLGIVFFMYYCGVVPLWLPVIQTVLAAGIVFGVVRTGGMTGGGIVPD